VDNTLEFVFGIYFDRDNITAFPFCYNRVLNYFLSARRVDEIFQLVYDVLASLVYLSADHL
jgi:hypothetical protein